jgi:hypothetical protein
MHPYSFRHATAAAALAAVAAVAPVLTGTIPVAWGGGRITDRTEPASLAVAGPAGWARLPAAPVAVRTAYAAVWTGKQMIVFGGLSHGPTHGPTFYGDGAAYDPATRTWTKVPAGPLSPRVAQAVVWTGKDVLIFGGVGSGFWTDGAAYDPAARTWRKLAPIPASLKGTPQFAVWTGKVMVAWDFVGPGNSGSRVAATYKPATNSWTVGTAPAPANIAQWGDVFWTGKQMLVWGNSGLRQGRIDGFAYNPATGKWSTLPPSPFGRTGRFAMLAAWTGKYLVVGGGTGTVGLHKDAATYDPATRTWTRLPDAPVGFEGNSTAPDIWTGSSVISIEDAVPGGRPLSLDLTTRRWSLGPKAPVPGRVGAHELWTGSQVLVWGGAAPCCKVVKQGYSYTP